MNCVAMIFITARKLFLHVLIVNSLHNLILLGVRLLSFSLMDTNGLHIVYSITCIIIMINMPQSCLYLSTKVEDSHARSQILMAFFCITSFYNLLYGS
jgi:hypothetical protein